MQISTKELTFSKDIYLKIYFQFSYPLFFSFFLFFSIMNHFDPDDLLIINKWCDLQAKLDEANELFDSEAFYKEIKQSFNQNLYRSIFCFCCHMKNVNFKIKDVYDRLIAMILEEYPDFSQNMPKQENNIEPYSELIDFIKADDFDSLQEFSSKHDDFFDIHPNSFYPTIEDAAKYGACRCFKFFYLNGQLITEKVIDNAVASGNLEIVRICSQNGMDYKKYIDTAIQYHRNDIVEWILFNSPSEIEINLSLALRFFNYRCFFKYYTNDISPEMRLYDDIPIITAAGIGNIDIIKLLIKQGNNIDEVNRNWTPLLMAAKNGQNETITFLLDNGADINYEEDSGWFSIYNAANSHMESTVFLLLERGATIKPTDNYGFSFASYAGPDLMYKIKQYQKMHPSK